MTRNDLEQTLYAISADAESMAIALETAATHLLERYPMKEDAEANAAFWTMRAAAKELMEHSDKLDECAAHVAFKSVDEGLNDAAA